MTTTTSETRVRWAAPSDVKDVLKIDRQWRLDKEDGVTPTLFQNFVKRPDAHHRGAVILKLRRETAGFALFYCLEDELVVYDLCVRPDLTRRGFGRLLLSKLVDFPDRFYARGRTSTLVRESDLRAQQFLRACGWKCDRIVANYFDWPLETGYHFHA